MRTLLIGLIAIFGFVQNLEACAVCYGSADDVQTKGLNYAIVTLLIVLGVMYGLFLKFFIGFTKRAQRLKTDLGH